MEPIELLRPIAALAGLVSVCVRTAGRNGSEAVPPPAQLDAESLGLDRLLVSDNAEAGDRPTRAAGGHRNNKKGGEISDRLRDL